MNITNSKQVFHNKHSLCILILSIVVVIGENNHPYQSGLYLLTTGRNCVVINKFSSFYNIIHLFIFSHIKYKQVQESRGPWGDAISPGVSHDRCYEPSLYDPFTRLLRFLIITVTTL